MTTENNTTDTIQNLVTELNRLKRAAEMLENAQDELVFVRSDVETRISNVENFIRKIQTTEAQQTGIYSLLAREIKTISTQNERLEKWLAIEIENVRSRISNSESKYTALTLRQDTINETLALAKKNNELIWIAFWWLGILTLACALYYFSYR